MIIHLQLSLGVCRLLSVVCKLFTFQASSPKPLGRLEPNLAGMFLGWTSTVIQLSEYVYMLCTHSQKKKTSNQNVISNKYRYSDWTILEYDNETCIYDHETMLQIIQL
jgi:hypothetical protein